MLKQLTVQQNKFTSCNIKDYILVTYYKASILSFVIYDAEVSNWEKITVFNSGERISAYVEAVGLRLEYIRQSEHFLNKVKS